MCDQVYVIKIVMFWSDKSLISRAIHTGFLEMDHAPAAHISSFLVKISFCFFLK